MARRTGIVLVFMLIAAIALATGCTQTSVQPVKEMAPAQSEAPPTPSVAPPSSGESNPQADKVTVPDVVSRGMTSARMVLGMNHLTFEVVSDPPGADLPMDNSVTITKQDPAADTIVDPGSTVTLTIKAK